MTEHQEEVDFNLKINNECINVNTYLMQFLVAIRMLNLHCLNTSLKRIPQMVSHTTGLDILAQKNFISVFDVFKKSID